MLTLAAGESSGLAEEPPILALQEERRRQEQTNRTETAKTPRMQTSLLVNLDNCRKQHSLNSRCHALSAPRAYDNSIPSATYQLSKSVFRQKKSPVKDRAFDI
jgi:hypothetical protein